jgi:hypothetical protein
VLSSRALRSVFRFQRSVARPSLFAVFLTLSSACSTGVWRKAFAPETWPTWATFVVGIVVAVIYWKTLRAIEKQTEANHKSADAAHKSADALVSAERAWVMVEVHWATQRGQLFRNESSDGTVRTMADVNLICRNQGKTPAWITERHIRIEVTDSVAPQPQLQGAEISYDPEPLAVGGADSFQHWSLIGDGWAGEGRFVLIYGVVKYRDVFSPSRETWFGYIVKPDGHRLERIAHPEYNKNT